MSKEDILTFFKYYNVYNSFTVKDVVRVTFAKPNAVRITINRLFKRGFIAKSGGKGLGRGRGRAPKRYKLTPLGISWLRVKGVI
jgi:predicted ArsR family transcriptional regulator